MAHLTQQQIRALGAAVRERSFPAQPRCCPLCGATFRQRLNGAVHQAPVSGFAVSAVNVVATRLNAPEQGVTSGGIGSGAGGSACPPDCLRTASASMVVHSTAAASVAMSPFAAISGGSIAPLAGRDVSGAFGNISHAAAAATGGHVEGGAPTVPFALHRVGSAPPLRFKPIAAAEAFTGYLVAGRRFNGAENTQLAAGAAPGASPMALPAHAAAAAALAAAAGMEALPESPLQPLQSLEARSLEATAHAIAPLPTAPQPPPGSGITIAGDAGRLPTASRPLDRGGGNRNGAPSGVAGAISMPGVTGGSGAIATAAFVPETTATAEQLPNGQRTAVTDGIAATRQGSSVSFHHAAARSASLHPVDSRQALQLQQVRYSCTLCVGTDGLANVRQR